MTKQIFDFTRDIAYFLYYVNIEIIYRGGIIFEGDFLLYSF